jgi:hypothetical protein
VCVLSRVYAVLIAAEREATGRRWAEPMLPFRDRITWSRKNPELCLCLTLTHPKGARSNCRWLGAAGFRKGGIRPICPASLSQTSRHFVPVPPLFWFAS